MHALPYGRGRGLRGPVGIGRCACDKTNIINHVHAHLAGLGGVGRVSVYHCFAGVAYFSPGSRDILHAGKTNVIKVDHFKRL